MSKSIRIYAKHIRTTNHFNAHFLSFKCSNNILQYKTKLIQYELIYLQNMLRGNFQEHWSDTQIHNHSSMAN